MDGEQRAKEGEKKEKEKPRMDGWMRWRCERKS